MLPKSRVAPVKIGFCFAGRGVGTQNYSSAANSQYAAAGAVADMFLQNGTSPVGKHFFVKNGDGSISPAFTRVDAQVRAYEPSYLHL